MNDDLLARFLTGRATMAEGRDVSAWRKLSDENEEHFQEISDILNLAAASDQSMPRAPAPTAESIITAASESSHPRFKHSSTWNAIRASRRRFWPKAAVAAAATVLLLAAGSYLTSGSWKQPDLRVKQFVTGPSEQATVVLVDSTVIRLGPESRLILPSQSAGREVSLIGKAFFSVARDESRPFTIRTGSGKIRVLGTRFAVDASVEELQLVVVQGSVALTGINGENEVRVGDREMARVVRGTRLPIVDVPDTTIVADWVGKFLAFQNTPLRTAVKEIEVVYGVEIEIRDPALADRTITAWFADWEIKDVMDVVCTVVGAECSVGDSKVLMDFTRVSDESEVLSET